MKKTLVILLAGLIILAFGAGIVLAESPLKSSASYAVPWDVVAGGGGKMSSTHYAISGTTGQTGIGPGSSSGYTIGAGYWYGAGEHEYQIYLPLGVKSSVP
jgi:membrane-associated PAP2 superfamily phosphatase